MQLPPATLCARNQLDSIAASCSRRGVPFIEDCAESFVRGGQGLIDGGAHPDAELVLFSFGSIKVLLQLFDRCCLICVGSGCHCIWWSSGAREGALCMRCALYSFTRGGRVNNCAAQ